MSENEIENPAFPSAEELEAGVGGAPKEDAQEAPADDTIPAGCEEYTSTGSCKNAQWRKAHADGSMVCLKCKVTVPA